MNRLGGWLMSHRYNTESADAIDQLHRAGWSVGEAAFATETRGHVWVVDGRNGENRIRVDGETQVEAWRRALVAAREPKFSGRR